MRKSMMYNVVDDSTGRYYGRALGVLGYGSSWPQWHRRGQYLSAPALAYTGGTRTYVGSR